MATNMRSIAHIFAFLHEGVSSIFLKRKIDHEKIDIASSVLQKFQEYRADAIALSEFRQHVVATGYLERVREMYLQPIGCSLKEVQSHNVKLPPAALQFVLRHFDNPTLYETPHYDSPFPEKFSELGLELEALEFLKRNADVTPQLVKFITDLIENGELRLSSPFTGNPVSAKAGFAFYLSGKPYIFYIFEDVEPFLCMVNPNMGNLIALYFPYRNLIVGQKIDYSRIISYLKFLFIKYSDKVNEYLYNKTPRKMAFVSSFMQHAGHTILNELTGYDVVVSNYHVLDDYEVCLGPHEFYDILQLFPEIDRSPISRLPGKSDDLFRHMLDNNNLPIRPTMRHYRISDSFRTRMQQCVAPHNEGISKSEISQRPLIWIEIRNNHRIWLNQKQGILDIIASLAKSHPEAAVFIAGWSKPQTPTKPDSVEIEKDFELYKEIEMLADRRVSLICGVGLSAQEKLEWAYQCDACVIGYGSGITIPCLVANKPTVIHANRHYTSTPAMAPELDDRLVFADDLVPYEVIPIENITDEQGVPRFQVRGYAVDGKIVYSYLLKALSRGGY